MIGFYETETAADMNGFWAIDLLVLISMILVRLIAVRNHAKSYACISARTHR